MLLAIETSTRQLGVAIAEGGRVLASYEVLADYPHAVELPGAVTRVLEAARTTLSRIEEIVIDIGPGSFTGLRIGLAFAKALAFGTKKPMVAVPSLDVLAAQVLFAPGLVCPLLDARQQNVYAALYQMDGGDPVKRSGYFLGPLPEWLPKITSATLFLGDGCGLYHDQLVSELGDNARFAPHDAWLPRVAALCRLGAARVAQGQRDDPATLVPMYLYPLDCSVRGPDRPTAVLPKAAPSVL